MTAPFWQTSVFLRHRPASHRDPSPPGTPAPDSAPRRYLCTKKHLHKGRALPRRLCRRRGGGTGGETGRPQASGHGPGGSEVLRPPGQGSGVRRRPATNKPHRRLENGVASPRAQLRRLSEPPGSALLTTFPLIGASAHTLIGQFPRSLGLREESLDRSSGPAHTTLGTDSLSFPSTTW